ncbi:MAG: J domain-containing protein, partial [Lachnospiraceae bacterium]|nr:J domain-containing protein [Lachnospiraceae bacterium]
EILEGGFRTLCREREDFETEKEKYRNRYAAGAYQGSSSLNVTAYKNGVFFNGIDNVLALKKRYRDLLKIFHPDNMDGDSATVQEINREYDILKDQF